jgi:hypothetical protein
MNSLNTKKTPTYDVGNPDPGLEHAQNSVRFKAVKGIPNPSILITGSSTAIHILYKQTIKTCTDSLPLKRLPEYPEKTTVQ